MSLDFEEMLSSILEGMSFAETRRLADRVVKRLNLLDSSHAFRIEDVSPTGAAPVRRGGRLGGFHAFWMKRVTGVDWGSHRRNMMMIEGEFVNSNRYTSQCSQGDPVIIGRTNADGTKQTALCEFVSDPATSFFFVDSFAHIHHTELSRLRPIYRGHPEGKPWATMLANKFNGKPLAHYTDAEDAVHHHPALSAYAKYPSLFQLLTVLKEIGF